MTDEFTKFRTTKIVKRVAKGVSEMAADGYEPAQSLIENAQGFCQAVEDAQASLESFYGELDDAAILAIYEADTGVKGKREVIYAVFPDHHHILDSILEPE